MSQFDELPEGWVATTVGEATDILDRLRIPLNAQERASKQGPYPYYGANGKVDSINEYIFDGEYTLIAEDGGYFDSLGKDVSYRVEGKFWVNNHAHIIQALAEMSPKFITYLFNDKNWMPYVSGTTRLKLTQASLKQVPINLPPLNEQRRIVEKIEALTARSRKAREALEAIPNLLDQFRQSVLAAAFRGDLTADWREQNPNVDKFWHQNLITSFRDSLEASKRQGRLWGSGTFAQEVDESWGEIPDSWNWVKVIDLGYNPDEVVQIGPMSMKSNEFVDEGTIVLNVGCVQWSGINLDKCNFLPPDRASDFERYRVKANDILFTRSGEVGRSAIVPDELDSSLMTFHLLRVRTMSDICIPEYLFLCFRGCSAVKHQIEKSTIGATRAGFNTKLLQNIWLPLPSIKEQAEVLLQIRQRLSKITLLETQLAEFSEDLNQLDQSILAKAFRGELVPQDPNDEPANLLLERIRAERERLGNSKKRGKAKT